MPASPGLLSRQYLPASTAIYTSVALVAFEGTAVAAALPQLAGDLGRLDLLPWAVTAYLFASGVTTVMAGPLVDALGARVIFRWAAVVFTITGFAAGLATTMPMLIGVRLVQGAGSGLLIASTLTAVNLIYPDELAGRAFAANSTIWGIMGASAPAIAAFMLTSLSWRWIFFVNLPLGLIALVTGWSRLSGPQKGAEAATVDWRGVLLIAGFTLAMLFAIDRAGFASLAWVAFGILLLGFYGWHARRHPRPVVRLDHVMAQPYAGLNSVTALVLMAGLSTNLYITLYVSAGRGGSASLTAWSVLWFTIGWTAGANASSKMLERMAETSVLAAGTVSAVFGLALAAPAALANWPLPVVFVGLFLLGIGAGLSTNSSLSLIRSATSANQIGRATAAHQFMRNQGYTLGSAIGGAVFLFVVAGRLGSVEPVQQLLAGEDIGVTGTVAEAVQAGYGATALVALGFLLLAFPPLLLLRRHLASARALRRGAGGSSGPTPS